MSRKYVYATHPNDPTVREKRQTHRTYTHVVWIRRTRQANLDHYRNCLQSSQGSIEVHERLLADPNRVSSHPYHERQLARARKTVKTLTEEGEPSGPGPWSVASWCGRIDLAMKQVSQWQKQGFETLVGKVDA